MVIASPVAGTQGGDPAPKDILSRNY